MTGHHNAQDADMTQDMTGRHNEIIQQWQGPSSRVNDTGD